jgi:hypothetical protein
VVETAGKEDDLVAGNMVDRISFGDTQQRPIYNSYGSESQAGLMVTVIGALNDKRWGR